MKYLFKQATIINEGKSFVGDVLTNNERIEKIDTSISDSSAEEINCEGKYLVPGSIDAHVHFREPGLTNKADIHSGSRAALSGGITSFMEMPNTKPNTLSQELLQDKFDIAAASSNANYSFYLGASNDNIEEILKTDPTQVCGVKVFMGASTGNMLVDNSNALNQIFSKVPFLICTHCEDEPTVQKNMQLYREKYGEDVPIKCHPEIRSEAACFKSSAFAIELAKKYNSRLHILHLSTEKELSLLDNTLPLSEKRITAEVCVHHLWFSDEDYESKGTLVKWNPAIKKPSDRAALWMALNNDTVDVIGTDHAPHTLQEKKQTYFKAPSGGPLVQHALLALLQKADEGLISKEKVIEKTAHAPAVLYGVVDRGFIREGYFADIAIVDPNHSTTVAKDNIMYKCGWSPFEGIKFGHTIEKTFVNGHLAYDKGQFLAEKKGERLTFNRKD